MSPLKIIPNDKRVNLDLILKEEFHQSSDANKYDLKFGDLRGNLHNREILCLNDNEILKGQMGKGTFKCEYCDFKCISPEDLKSHIPNHLQIIVDNMTSLEAEESSEEEKIHVCEECGIMIVFTNTKKNQNHIQIYNNNSKESCEKCNNKLIKVGDIHKIIQDNIPNKEHTCPYCEFLFSSSEDLYCHMEQHNIDKELLTTDSEDNDIEFSENDDSGYLEDVLVIQELKKIKREILLSTLSKENPNLHDGKRKNIKKENNEANITKNFNCNIRNARFRPYACSKCSFRAVEEKTLEKHITTHLTEKKFPCPHCSYKGMKAINLQKHLKTHNSEKPFECSLCQYRTSTRSNLIRHKRQHTGEKRFVCTECDYKGAQKIALQNHMKSWHSNDGD